MQHEPHASLYKIEFVPVNLPALDDGDCAPVCSKRRILASATQAAMRHAPDATSSPIIGPSGAWRGRFAEYHRITYETEH